MKYVFAIFFSIMLTSCSSQKVTSQFDITNTEKDIINNFLKFELASDAYKYRRNSKVVIIKNAIPKKQVLDDYLSIIRNFKESLIDTLQAVKMRKEFENETQYYWKSSDFRIKNLLTQSIESFEKSIKKEEYLNLPPRIIIHLSVPLIINDKEALVGFMSGGGDLGYTSINSGLILMVRNNENKWVFEQFLGSKYS